MLAIFPMATSDLTGPLSPQFETHAAELDAPIRDRIPALRRPFFDTRPVGNFDHQRAQTLPRFAALDEADRSHVHRDPAAFAVGRKRLLEDGAPVPPDARRVGALDDDLGEALADIGLDRVRPAGPAGRRIGAAQIFFAVGPVELDHRRAAIARMELYGVTAFGVDNVRGAPPQAVGMPAAPFRIVAIEDRHVAADSARTLEE